MLPEPGDSSIGDTCGTISPSFFSVQSKPLDFACSFDFEPRGKPQNLEAGVILVPNFFEGFFFLDQVEGRKVEGGNTAAQYSLLSRPCGTRLAPGGGPRVASLLSFAPPQNPEGAWFGIVSG